MSGQLGDLVVSLSADVARFRSDMGKATLVAQESSVSISNALGGVEKTIASIGEAFGVVTAALAGGAMFKDMISTTKEVTGEVVKLKNSLGISAEEASVMRIALGDVFLSADDIAGAASRITKQLVKNEDAFKSLGVATRDSNGDFRSTTAIMAETNSKLMEFKEGTDRNVEGIKIYGKGWEEARKTLKLTSEAMEDGKKRAEELHLVIGDDGIKAAKDYRLAMKDIGDVAESVKFQIGSALIPELTKLAVRFGDTASNGIGPFIKGLHSVQAEIIRLAMLADKVGGTMTSIGMMLFAPGRLIGNKNSSKQFEQMADWNIMFEERYKEKDKQLQTLANLEVGLDANGNPINKKSAKTGGSKRSLGGEPKEGKDDSQMWASAHDKYLNYLKSFSAKEAELVKTAAQEQLEINQEAWDWGLISQQQYLAKKWALSVNEIGREIQLKQEEVQRYKDEVGKYANAEDAKGAAAYHEALNKQAVAEKELIALEGKLSVTRMQNSNEYKKALYDQNKQLMELHNQFSTLNNDNLTAALSQQSLIQQSPEFLKMSKAAQDVQKEIWANQNKYLTDSNSVISGMKAGLNEYAKTAKDVGAQVKNYMSNMMKGMEDALVNFVKTGKLNFKDLADSIISDMIRIAIQKNITGPMASAIGSLFSQANGGAWSNGVQMFANGGIVSGPTAFGMAGGSMGVMGEAGAEAIMPLRRTSNGRLGVDVVGGLHDATAPNVSIYIENKSNGEVKQGSTNLQFDGKNFIISTIIENVQQNGPLRGLLGAGAY